ncbi:MAG: Xaa-Pro peptidase family protein [Chloroflexota bacterium]|nr:Xaa-Pro peptidase family protein [Chloroflexota bacterium]
MTYHVQTPGVGKAGIVEQIKASGLAGVLLTSPENVYYTSGLPALPGSGNPILFALKNQLPFFVYIAADGTMTLLCWIGATMGFTFDVDDVRSFFNRDSALEELHDFLQATLKPGMKVGVESSCPLYVLKQLYEFVDPSTIEPVDELLLKLRLSKTEAEIALMRKATAIVEATVTELRGRIATGISRLELIGAAKSLLFAHGATGVGHTTIAFGTSNPEIAFDERLEDGQLITLDLGAVVDGYTSDNRRLFYTGPVPDDLQQLHHTMCGIVDQLGQALRPGTAFADLYNLAAEIYGTHDLPPYFINVGHSIGLQTEEAWITFDSPYTVQAGMVLNIELYTPYHDGTNIGNEETFLVTESGTIKLTQTDPAIQSIVV